MNWLNLQKEKLKVWWANNKPLTMSQRRHLHRNNTGYVPSDEFDTDLRMNTKVMARLSHEKREEYIENLLHRRSIAHEKNLREIKDQEPAH